MRRFELNLMMLVLVVASACAPTRTLRTTEIEQKLLQAHQEWRGTPYRLGGTTRNGIDCSSFVQTVMRDYLNQEVPRSTESQLRVGFRVRPQQLQPGDLVFYRTGRQRLHMGIYINEGRFLHASTSNGVMISRMDETYWSRRFLQARRI
jgi:cell wall-associated NlpC family hydrolase